MLALQAPARLPANQKAQELGIDGADMSRQLRLKARSGSAKHNWLLG